ncbi:MAG: ATP-binding protein [Eubacteriales bacterium]|nr:ATP-binding protein [Eubacteriales bacterium]
MTRKIFRSIFLASLVVLLASFGLSSAVLYAKFTHISQEQLRMQTELAAKGVNSQGEQYLTGLEDHDYRITWVADDGQVLYDSRDLETAAKENHLEREEIQRALENGFGESKRYSDTLLERSLYAAIRLEDGSVLRFSMSQGTVWGLLQGLMSPIALILLLAILGSWLLAARLSKRVVKPLNTIDLDHPTENEGYDELSPLLHRISTQQQKLKERKEALAQKQKELDVILENMSEGMLLLQDNGHIISINAAAITLLETTRDCIGQDILMVSRKVELQEIIDAALSGKKEERVIDLLGGRYQVSASPVRHQGELQGAAVIFFDVTDREQAEELRREFSANVSHELKTPLHAISGYAELIKGGMVKQEDVMPFSEKIYTEAKRTIQLVEDIISLSHLDEGAGDMQWEELDVYTLGQSVVGRLQSEAEKAEVTISAEGEATQLYCMPALLETIIYDLCDNAIKYNRPGGWVKLEVGRVGDEAKICVSDNGIGIPAADHKRIFERFYRVDKSHSRSIGGTGLGLSIVKHAVSLHGGRIDLQSNVDSGTMMTVWLPLSANQK